MRYGIISDIHSNLEAFKAVIKALKKEKVDKYLCAGDIVGYGADPQECIDKIKEKEYTVVAGNHDWGVVGLFSKTYFNPAAYEAILWTQNNINDFGRLFLSSLHPVFQNEDLTLVHGTLAKPEEFNYLIDMEAARDTFAILQTRICFVGHSHAPGVFVEESGNILYLEENTIELREGSKYIVNVGSVGQPRDGDRRAAYCVYDKEKKSVKINRVEYNVVSASKKIILSGLPKYLGERLLLGM